MSFAVRPIGLASASGFVFSPTISVDTSNYNLKAAAIAAGWDQVAPLLATVTVNSGIVLSANDTGQYGFDTGVTFPTGTVLTLLMQGAYVLGMGGRGGGATSGIESPATNGGPALRAQHPITIDATGGVIGGGGGGGAVGWYSTDGLYCAGGGGRSGRTNSAGGVASDNGKPGTFMSGGDAGYVLPPNGVGGTTGPGGGGIYGGGGGGGGWGASGGITYKPGAAGGAAVVGDSNITWINTGTRYGSVS